MQGFKLALPLLSWAALLLGGMSFPYAQTASLSLGSTAAVSKSLTLSPTELSLAINQQAVLTASFTGMKASDLKWKILEGSQGGNLRSLGTSGNLAMTRYTAPNRPGIFHVRVTGKTLSATCTVTVTAAQAPTIVTQPQNAIVTEGQSATFSVSATGTSPLSYQWRKNGGNLSGATAASYTTPPTLLANNASKYSVVVSNTAGNVTSNEALLTVNPVQQKPTISSFSATPSTITAGQSSTLNWNVSGATSLSLDQGIGSVTGSSRIVTPAATTSYTLTATNVAGSASATTRVTVNPATVPPNITAQPQSTTVTAGQSANFSVTATGTAPLGYQWRKNSVNLSGATSASYTTPITSSVDNGSKYSVVVSNVAGSVTSSEATLTVNPAQPAASTWVIGYYVGYQSQIQPPSAVDYSAMTHVALGAAIPKADGSFETHFYIDNTSGPAWARDTIARAHAVGTKAILMLGGAGASQGFKAVADPAIRAAFVNNLKAIMDSYGFDGFDLDWEPIDTADRPHLLALAQALRQAMPDKVMTLPVGWNNSNFNELADPYWGQLSPYFDRISIMSYEMNWRGDGWYSWHFAPLFGEKGNTPSSVDNSVKCLITAGVPKTKIAIGIGFYGQAWEKGSWVNGQFVHAASGPYVTTVNQNSDAYNVRFSDNTFSYSNIMRYCYETSAYHWDDAAKGAYLSWDAPKELPGPSWNNPPIRATFMPFEDERSVTEKGTYVRAQGLGGTIIWTISEGYLEWKTTGEKDPMMKAVKAAFLGGSQPALPVISSFSANPASITLGQSSSLSWSVTNATTLSLDQGIGTVTGTSRNVTPTATTIYTLTATNAAGGVNATATVTVNPAPILPAITVQPQSVSVTVGQTANFSVTATGTAPLSYQWRKNASNLSGATNAHYTTPATTSSDNGALFSVVVSNTAGSVTSANATLTVNAAPSLPTISVFTSNPGTISAGQNSTLSWNVTGATSLSLDQGIGTVTGTSHSVNPPVTTTYMLTATNAVGSTTATTTVNVTPIATGLVRVPFAPLPTNHGVLKISWGNGEPLVMKDRTSGKNGELFGLGISDKLHLFKSPDLGSTWTIVDPSNDESIGTNAWGPNTLLTAVQDSAGRVHLLCKDGSSGQVQYTRLALAYTGTAITGFASEVKNIALPGMYNTNVDVRAALQVVTSPGGSECLVFSVNDNPSNGFRLQMGQAPLTATKTADFLKLDGSVGATVAFSTTAFNNHDHSSLFAQLGASRDLWVFWGPIDAEYGPADSSFLTRLRIRASGPNAWTLENPISMVGSNAASSPELLNVVGTQNYVWLLYFDPNDGLSFDRISADGSHVHAIVPSPEGLPNRNGWGALSVAEDEKRIWAIWNGMSRQGPGVQDITTQAFWNGSAWTKFDDPVKGDCWGMVSSSNWREGVVAARLDDFTMNPSLSVIRGGSLVDPGNPKPVISSFSASPASITLGQSSSLNWAVTNATTLSLDQGIGVVTGSSRTVTPNTTTTYVLTASNSAGSVNASTTVTVNPAPVLPSISSFTASPATITVGQSSNLNWTVTNATGLSLDQGIGPVTGTSRTVSPTLTTTYTLTATNAVGHATAQATVTVQPVLPTGSSRYPAGQIQSPVTSNVAARLRAVFQAGAQAGLKANVFFKAGDSITVNTSFLEQFKYPAYVEGQTMGWDFAYHLGTYTNLQGARDYFLTGSIGTNNPYDRVSAAAQVGAGTEWVLTAPAAGGPAPLDAEMQATQAAYGIIMFGTNDLGAPQTDSYVYRWAAKNLLKVVDRCLSAKTLPLLTAPPPKTSSPEQLSRTALYSRLVRAIAQGRQIPFIDYFRASLPLSSYGLGSDGVHPNAMQYNRACFLTPEGLQYGHNMRNLITLQSLDRMYRLLVQNQAAPDPETAILQGSGTEASPYLVDSEDFADFRAPVSGTSELRYRLNLSAARTLQAAVVGAEGCDYGLELSQNGQIVGSSNDGTLKLSLTAGTFTLRVFATTSNKYDYALALLLESLTQQAPSITAQPQSQTVTVGQTASFSVTATGTPAPGYQWRKNGTTISGATAANYTTPATTSSDNGALFSVVVSNTAGSVTSANANLTVNAAPVLPTISSFTANPSTIAAGQSSTLSWTVTGATSLSLNQGIGTVSGNSRSVSPATTTTYTLTATNAVGSATANATVTVNPVSGSAIIIDHTNTDLAKIPSQWIPTAKQQLRIGYSHTSHGSQPVTGMMAFRGSAGSPYYFDFSSWDAVPGVFFNDQWANPYAADLGHNGDLAWRNATQTQLNKAGNDRNVVIWSWCGGVSDNTPAGIDTYLSAMNALEAQYPAVKFVYMTGHLDGGGKNGNLHLMNERIRNYCRSNNKILFDFADIESYDPDGLVNYMEKLALDSCEYDKNGDGNPWGDGNWASEWIAAHPGHELTNQATACGDCAHSQKLNCILKGRAFWWLFARLAGWDGSTGTTPIAPTITTQPQSQTVTAGQTASFSVTANGTTPLNYQWRKNGSAISAATSASYTTPATSSTDNGALFSVMVSNTAGSVTSANATLTVNAAPQLPVISSFSANPSSITAGQSSTLNWSVTGAISLSLDQGIGTVTGTSRSVSPASTTTYTLTATNSSGTATASATVTVQSAPPAGTWSPIALNNEQPGGYNSDVFRWLDSSKKQRTAVLTRNTAQDPGGSYGGFLRQYRFFLPNDTERVVTGTGVNGWNGFGYLVNHFGNGSPTWGESSQNHSGSTRTAFAGRHHAIHEFKWTYPMRGINVTATVHWFMATGQDHPIYAITYDTSAAGASGFPTGDSYLVDSRSPYGDLAWTGDGSNPNVDGVAWGDKYKFRSTLEPVTMQSGWDYSQSNTVPYARMYVKNPDAEIGSVQTLSWTQHNTGGTWLTDRWGQTSAGPMPDNWNWPYQMCQYEMDATNPTRSKRFAWGLMYGAVGQSQYWGYGYENQYSGHPYQSYSLHIVLGRQSAQEVAAQVAQVERMLQASLSATTGTLVNAGPGGIGRSDSVTYPKVGYSGIYGAYEIRANAGLFNFSLNGSNLKNPIFLIRDLGALPTQIYLDGSLLVADVDYFASYDSSAQILWLTLNRSWNGSHTLSNGNALPPSVSVSLSPQTATVETGQTTQFTATVSNASNTLVTWTATGGTISSTGLFTAPATQGSFQVVATSVADTSKSASATVTVIPASSGSVITPDDPGSADLSFTVRTQEERKPISPYIYGMNFYGNVTGAPRNLSFNRMGGNRWTAYNWENNASNSGTDWGPYSNDSYLGGGNTPAEAVRGTMAADQGRGMASLMTIQLQGYVSADKNGLVNPSSEPNYLTTRFKQVVFKKPSPFVASPDLNDTSVYMDEFLHVLKSKFAVNPFGTGAALPTFISLDNEPELWDSTHNILQPTRPTPEAYISRTVDLCKAIKDEAPEALIFGPVHYGFNGIYNWQGAAGFTANYWFTDKYLQDLKTASDQAGKRLLDVYDFHWYSEATGDGQRIINLNGSTLTDNQIQAIVQSPRSLWDSTYTESSWISQWVTNGPIYMIPRIQSKIDAVWPNTRIAITEYDNGGGGHIAGAIAQADNLGTFGKLGVFAASFWGDNRPFTFAGFKMFRDFDNNLGRFGDLSVKAGNSDWGKGSIWASVDQSNPDRIVLVLCNKTKQAQSVNLRLWHTRRLNVAEVYELSGSSTTPARKADLSIGLVNALTPSLPALSVTTLVIKP